MANAILRTSHSCGTKKGLVCFDDGNAYCFRCGTFIPDYLTGDELKTKTRIGKSKEQIEQELNNVKDFPNMDFEFRKIKSEYYNYFNVKYSFSEVNKEPETVYFPYTLKGELSGYKVRLIEEKRMWSIGRVNPECELFGWTQAITTGSRKLFITEGEYDAIALYQILHESQKGTQWADRRPAVVSLPNGVRSASKAILNNLKEINNFFQEIVLVFDNDEAGNRATEEVLRVVPEAKVATLPLKDANECLDKGQTLACKNAVLFQAKSNKNTRIGKKRVKEDIDEPKTYPCVNEVYRGIKPEYFDKYGVKRSVSETDGETTTAIYFPYRGGWKVRLTAEKRMWGIGKFSEELFGLDTAIKAGSKRLFITEGEYDAIALYQIMVDANKGTKYADRAPAVVSLPNGAGNASRAILANIKEINDRGWEVVLVFDQDEAGKKAVEDVLKILPDALVAQLPAKDANECLEGGMSKAALAAVLWNAKSPKNSRIVQGSSLRELALKQPEFGAPYPWDWLTRKTRGIRFGETIYLGAGQKQGKSEFVNTLAAWCMKDLGWNVFLVKPEEANPKTYKMVAGKMEGKFFHDPTKEFDKEAFDRAADILDKKMYLLDLYQHVGWDSLKQDIRTAVEKNNCKAVFIDPITNLVNGMDAASANTKLQEIAQELSAMAKDLNCVIFIFCHLRNPDNGPPHERGGKVLSSQFAGSRAMARSCNYMLGLEGNRDPELSEEERNMRKLVLLEDREYGEVGELSMYWDSKTGLFNPMEG